MILTGDSIGRRGIITPFVERTVFEGMSYGKSYAGYDIRIREPVYLRSGASFTIASSMERFTMPTTVLGIVHDKSTWARRGLSVFNTVIEPGWYGFLTLELVYHGSDRLLIKEGSPIAQVVFYTIESEVKGYDGKYQDQPAHPVEAKEEQWQKLKL